MPIRPEFFDIFGFIGFLYILIVSALALHGKRLPAWTLIILLCIGIVGAVVDGFIVYSFYLA